MIINGSTRLVIFFGDSLVQQIIILSLIGLGQEFVLSTNCQLQAYIVSLLNDLLNLKKKVERVCFDDNSCTNRAFLHGFNSSIQKF